MVPSGVGIDDGEVGVGAHPDRALPWVEPEDARRILGHHARHPRHREAALHHALAPHERHQRLDATGCRTGPDCPCRPRRCSSSPAPSAPCGAASGRWPPWRCSPRGCRPRARRRRRRRPAGAAGRSWRAGPSASISFSVSSRYCGQVSVHTRWPAGLRRLDPLEPALGREVDDVDRALRSSRR